MAQHFIEDKYYEWEGDDGTVIFTRIKYIVEALLHYRDRCINVIQQNHKQAPKFLKVESFEEFVRKVEKMEDIEEKIKHAEFLINKIDDILEKMATKTVQKDKTNSSPDKEQPDK